MPLMPSKNEITAPYKIYGEDNIEHGALTQFYDMMKLECTIKGALMPDAHHGYTLPIGGVLATRDTIFPSMVGFDIGCGMGALKLPYKKHEIEQYRKDIFDSIYRSVPTGVGGKNTHRRSKPIEDWDYNHLSRSNFLDNIMLNGGLADLATLGSGNHFIEIGHDKNNDVWVIIHSGSRGVGHKTATHWMSLACEGDKPKDGPYGFDTASENGMLYTLDMEFCLEFALENRKRMMQRVVKEIAHYCKGDRKIDWDNLINRNHNHAEYSHKLDAVIHRKGATHAAKGMMGVVPGNMRDGSFIVKGFGASDSMNSSSHGAGRKLSRTKAKEKLTMERFVIQMKGITAKVETGTIDESPNAYKDIFHVMDLQHELVEIIAHVKPLINIKAVNRSRGNRNKKKKVMTEQMRKQEADQQLNDCL
jgi:tRNA-splicing ligase RtcB (3'-phosphate/5'-hydroxy nucleic acid ligase)